MIRTRYTIEEEGASRTSTTDASVAQQLSEQGARVTAEVEHVDLSGYRTAEVPVSALMDGGDPR